METTEDQSVTVLGYKAFNNDMTCMNEFQYEVGKTYTMDEQLQLCSSDFHFCMISIDVLGYYDKDSKFAIIKASGEIEHDNDKSVCSSVHFFNFGIEKMNDLNYIGERMNRTLIIRLQGEYLTIRLYPRYCMRKKIYILTARNECVQSMFNVICTIERYIDYYYILSIIGYEDLQYYTGGKIEY